MKRKKEGKLNILLELFYVPFLVLLPYIIIIASTPRKKVYSGKNFGEFEMDRKRRRGSRVERKLTKDAIELNEFEQPPNKLRYTIRACVCVQLATVIARL